MPSAFERRLRGFKADRAKAEPAELPELVRLPGGEELTGPYGTCCLVSRVYRESLDLPEASLERLRRNLRLLYGVGPRTEEKLRALGYESLEQLLAHDRWGKQANELLAAMDAGDLHHLRRRGARDRELFSFFAPEDLVFLDIETTGLYSSLPLFLVGMLHMADGGLHLRQYLARRYEEERAVLAHVAEELPRFKAIVSYNGRSFDLPYLRGRLLAHRIACRLDQIQVDLLGHARRRYRGILPDCRLVTVEAAVLARDGREGDVPGHLIPELYHQFVKTQDQAVIRGIMEHNAADLISLARMIRLVE